MSVRARAMRTFISTLVVLVGILFLSAGSLRFWQAWLYVALMGGFWFYFFLDLFKNDPKLLERRLRHDEQQPEQKLFQKLFTLITIPAYILTGLDFRFGWSGALLGQRWFGRAQLGHLPLAAVLAGQALAVAGYSFVFWVLKTNTFASSTIQVEAGQQVIQTGPYAIVRHPMYLGMAAMALGSPLALGSYVALPVFALLVPVLIYRLVHEERTLRDHLAGYREYCEQVRFRIVPGVW
jgi:protein-S-isoprenylcysteine O-methyltransferase Ste14